MNKHLKFILSIIVMALTGSTIGLGINIFISSNGFISTGFAGISLIIGRIFDKIAKTNYETVISGVLYILFNIPILILAWKKISKKFAILTGVHVIFTSIVLAVIPNNFAETLHLSVKNDDITLLDAALFAGAINGVANAFAFVMGGCAGGTDVLTLYFSIKKQITIGKLTTVINVFIILTSILVNGTLDGIKLAMYTMVYVIICSVVIDLIYVTNRRRVLLITTSKGNEIAKLINEKYVRGVTILDARGAYTGEHKDFLYCACSSFEIPHIIKDVKTIDPHAFSSSIEATKVEGNFIDKIR